MMQMIYDIWPIFPEVILALSALLLLMAGVFQGDKNTSVITLFAVSTLVLTSVVTLLEPQNAPLLGVSGFVIQNTFTKYMQVLVYIITALVILTTHRQLEQDGINRFEVPVLMLLSTLGMSFMLSANDFIMFFVGLELQTFPVYILVAMKRNSSMVSEAAVKYFIMGAIASIMILYGVSFIYGYTGTTEFERLAGGLSALPKNALPLILAMVFILAGVAFKVSIVPFHMWTPDVYEGSPTGVTLFIASAPKLAAMAFLIRMLYGPLYSYVDIWQPMILALSALSMVLGVFTALFQMSIKRLLAYSTIANMGYVFLGVGCYSQEGIQSVVVYLLIYMIMTIGVFACLMNMRRQGEMPVNIDDLKGLSRVYPKMSFALAVLMFSLAGIPPLAGFFAKLMVFMAAVDAGHYALVVLAVLTTVVGAAYYLKIIKVMYFDEPIGGESELPYDKNVSRETGWIIAATVAVNALFFIMPGPIISNSEEATAVLFERK